MTARGSESALERAARVQRAAASAGFDWPDAHGALAKVAEELDEVTDALGDEAAQTAEVGDLLFAVVSVARHLGVDPGAALDLATSTFQTRFAALTAHADELGIDLTTSDLITLLRLWTDAKAATS